MNGTIIIDYNEKSTSFIIKYLLNIDIQMIILLLRVIQFD